MIERLMGCAGMILRTLSTGHGLMLYVSSNVKNVMWCWPQLWRCCGNKTMIWAILGIGL